MWSKIKKWFRDSETLFWARVQMFIGAAGTVAILTDFSPLMAMPTKQQVAIFAIVFLQGVVTEYLRRRRATDL